MPQFCLVKYFRIYMSIKMISLGNSGFVKYFITRSNQKQKQTTKDHFRCAFGNKLIL